MAPLPVDQGRLSLVKKDRCVYYASHINTHDVPNPRTEFALSLGVRVLKKKSESVASPAPHSFEAEQAVLGGLLIDPKAWDTVVDRVSAEDFYRAEHRLIFQAMAALQEQDRPLDIVTVSEQLGPDGLTLMGGMPYLGTLGDTTPSVAHIGSYADIVRERAIARKLMVAARSIMDMASQAQDRPIREVLDTAEQEIFALSNQGRTGAGFVPIGPVLSAMLDHVDRLSKLKTSITGVSSGFMDLDEMTSGFQPGDLVIVAGRPSMGKTAFALNIMEHAVLDSHLAVAFFSLEMSKEQIAMRLFASTGRIDAQKLRNGALADEDFGFLTHALNQLSDSHLFVDDTSSLSALEIRARARRLHRDHPLGLIVVDYLQLLQGGGGRQSDNRATEVGAMTRMLKGLAKELHVPVIALSQLNRALEGRTNKRPIMSDLRESGSIEQDADTILFVYRDEVYNEDSPEKGVAEIIIGKQRNGPIGTVRLTFQNQHTRFENFAMDYNSY